MADPIHGSQFQNWAPQSISYILTRWTWSSVSSELRSSPVGRPGPPNSSNHVSLTLYTLLFFFGARMQSLSMHFYICILQDTSEGDFLNLCSWPELLNFIGLDQMVALDLPNNVNLNNCLDADLYLLVHNRFNSLTFHKFKKCNSRVESLICA